MKRAAHTRFRRKRLFVKADEDGLGGEFEGVDDHVRVAAERPRDHVLVGEGLDLRPADGLVIGDDRQSLRGRARQPPGLLAFDRELLSPVGTLIEVRSARLSCTLLS